VTRSRSSALTSGRSSARSSRSSASRSRPKRFRASSLTVRSGRSRSGSAPRAADGRREDRVSSVDTRGLTRLASRPLTVAAVPRIGRQCRRADGKRGRTSIVARLTRGGPCRRSGSATDPAQAPEGVDNSATAVRPAMATADPPATPARPVSTARSRASASRTADATEADGSRNAPQRLAYCRGRRGRRGNHGGPGREGGRGREDPASRG
jgi:hypothetical protein